MSKFAKMASLEHDMRRYPVAKNPRSLEELLTAWLKAFDRSWGLGSSIPVDWSLIGVRDSKLVQLARFSHETLDVYPDWISLSSSVVNRSKRFWRARRGSEFTELEILERLFPLILKRAKNISTFISGLTELEIHGYGDEAILWEFAAMRHRQLSRKFRKHTGHRRYSELHSAVRQYPCTKNDWEKIVLLSAAGHRACGECERGARDLLGRFPAHSKLIFRYGSEEAKMDELERRLDQDLMLVWQRYASDNSYGMGFSYAEYDGSYLQTPISGLLKKSVDDSFSRDSIGSMKDNAIHYSDILNQLNRQHLYATANSLAFSTSIPLGEAYIAPKADQAVISWYQNEGRFEVAEGLMKKTLKDYKEFSHLALREISDTEYQAILVHERDLFLEAIPLFLSGKMMGFAKEAYPAIENLLRTFVLMLASDNPDALPAVDSIIKKQYPKPLKNNSNGLFLTMGDLFTKAYAYRAIRRGEKREEQPWFEGLSLIEFFMTSNGNVGYGLNLRNDVAHGIIRRELEKDEGLAFLLSWLLAFSLVEQAGFERKARREEINKKTKQQ